MDNPRSPRLRGQYEALNEALPVDVLPCSNGEFLPGPATARQRAIMALAEEQSEATRRRLGMSRRSFVRSAAALSIGVWAIDQLSPGKWGSYATGAPESPAACDIEWKGAQLGNPPGEFIFDIQSHHVDPQGTWRVTNPGFHAFFAALWEQSGPLGGMPGMRADNSPRGFGYGGELDPIENLSRHHYLKELFLDSSTSMTVLSAVPSEPTHQPLPQAVAADTVETVNRLAGGTRRSVMHAFVMPNRGSLGTTSSSTSDPVFMQDEFDLMEANCRMYNGMLRGWKVYTPWGDVPNFSGWFLDDAVGLKFLQQIVDCGNKYGVPKLVACHKGFALPAFDQRAASPRDIGPAARQFPEVNFVVYHSGYDSETQTAYPGDDSVSAADRGVNSFIKSLRENGLNAQRHKLPGLAHGNSPNVYAEIGAVWRSVSDNADEAAHLLGKLITNVGPKRVCWGTDSLWFGSPQPVIAKLRAFKFTQQAKELYNLPHGLEGDADDPTRNAHSAASYVRKHPHVKGWPTDKKAHPERSIRNAIFGRNAARIYKVNPDAAIKALKCDQVEALRTSIVENAGTAREVNPYQSNELYGFRTDKDVLHDLATTPWSP